MALIAGITSSYIESIKNSSLSSITEFIPFITVIVIAVIIIVFIPTIVSGLSGMIQHASPLHMAMPVIRALPPKKGDKNDDNSNDPKNGPSSSPQQKQPVTKPYGSFPGDPIRMLAREERIHGKK